jgi:hypothetical protein
MIARGSASAIALAGYQSSPSARPISVQRVDTEEASHRDGTRRPGVSTFTDLDASRHGAVARDDATGAVLGQAPFS